MWQKIFPLNWQRLLLLRKLSSTDKNAVLESYLSKVIPARSSQMSETEFLVLDFETSGVNAKADHILSVGYTVVKKNRVCMSENSYTVIRQQAALNNENVKIHNLTESVIEQGVMLEEVLYRLLNDMAGRVLVAHNAEIEKKFIDQACLKIFGFQLPVRVLDTLQIEKKSRARQNQVIKVNELRLFNLRKAYGLPRYKAHNALEDAIATAELLLVQIARKCSGVNCKLKDFL